MQGVRALLKRRSVFRPTQFSFRGLSVQSCDGIKDDGEDTVLVEGKASSRVAILNRTDALNALNTRMEVTTPSRDVWRCERRIEPATVRPIHIIAARLKRLYESWEQDPDIGFVVVKGNGRAFCAGGDVVSLYHLMNEGKIDHCREFFKEAYSFVYLVGTYLKPHVALLNGITMGGGAGISIPGTFRVATNKTIFATPETLIGFHPDAGASFYLSHLPGYIGEYLGLTGEKLTGAEMVACGLATHYTDSARITLVEDRLGKLVTDDFSIVEGCLEEYGELVCPDKRSAMRRIEIIDKCFSLGTVEEIIDALECEASVSSDEWCTTTLKRLKEASPLGLKLSLKSIRVGRYQTLDQCLIREYRMSIRGITKQVSSDFSEGVRARLVDKDLNPKWNPPGLDLVSEDMVDSYFAPFGGSEPELDLPTKLREAFN